MREIVAAQRSLHTMHEHGNGLLRKLRALIARAPNRAPPKAAQSLPAEVDRHAPSDDDGVARSSFANFVTLTERLEAEGAPPARRACRTLRWRRLHVWCDGMWALLGRRARLVRRRRRHRRPAHVLAAAANDRTAHRRVALLAESICRV